MSRFAEKAKSGVFEVDEVDRYDPAVDCWCQYCGRQFNGSDSSGGHCKAPTPDGGYCCKSFTSNSGFNTHRTGRYEPNERRCRTSDELLAKGWTVDDNNTWRMPAPKTSPWKKETA